MEKVWDTETQEVHGGQTWRQCQNYVADFSVTTNAHGPPTSAVMAAKAALSDIHHYPPADTAEATEAFAQFTSWPADRLLVGNGASEFIDLVMKALPPGPFKPGPYKAAYMEYNRAAKAAGRDIVSGQADAAVTVLIHPNSPTGHFMELSDIRAMLDKMSGMLVIDESFMPFLGPSWRKASALELIDDYPDKLLVLASWTKLWACPGIRLGTIAGSSKWVKEIKRLQTPWSCNTPAQKFAVAAAADTDYMNKTWRTLPEWRRMSEERLTALGWEVNDSSPIWVPWIFVTCPHVEIAERAVAIAQDAGCPVRGCASFGVPECIRVGVRRPEHQEALFKAWEDEFSAVGATNGNH